MKLLPNDVATKFGKNIRKIYISVTMATDICKKIANFASFYPVEPLKLKISYSFNINHFQEVIFQLSHPHNDNIIELNKVNI